MTGTGTGYDYRPDKGFSGEDSFEIVVSDGRASATSTVTVNVAPKDHSEPWCAWIVRLLRWLCHTLFESF